MNVELKMKLDSLSEDGKILNANVQDLRPEIDDILCAATLIGHGLISKNSRSADANEYLDVILHGDCGKCPACENCIICRFEE